MILTLFLILFVLIGSVSAANDNTTTLSQDTTKEINQEKTGFDDSSLNKEILKISNENTTLKEPVSGGTFNDIQTAINNTATGETIELSGLYIGNGNAIIIDKNLTIIGTNGATLDAQGQSRIFFINGTGVTLKNINFINGFTSEYYGGGAIRWVGDNGTVNDCNFNKNKVTSTNSGAIHWQGNNGKINNCNFTNNTSTGSGGAITMLGDNGIINICNFTNNKGSYGGAIYCTKNNIIINNSYFINNNGNLGGAVYLYSGSNGVINNCIFNKNTATNGAGGALSWRGENGKLSNSNFTNNTSTVYSGGAISWQGNYGKINNCNFTSNKAPAQSGGAIFWSGYYGNISYSTFKDNKATNYRNIYNSNNVVLYNSTLETIIKFNNLIPDSSVDSSATVNFTFDDGTNLRRYNVILNNNNQTIKTFPYSTSYNYTYTWDKLAGGNYSITVGETNSDKNKYIGSYEPMKFKVTRCGSSVSINSIDNVTYNTEVVAGFHIENRTNITVIVKNVQTGKKIIFNNYTGSEFRINDLAAGEYNITIINCENENYTSSNASALFNISKASTKVNINSIINGTYKTENATVNFNILNSTTTQITVRDSKTGSVVYNNINFIGNIFTIGNLTASTYNITITNNGNENYTSSNASALFSITKAKLNPGDIIVNVTPGKGDATVNITVSKNFNGDVNVVINGTIYSISVVNGTGIKVLPLVPGKYNLTGVNITNNSVYEDAFISLADDFVVNKIIINPTDVIVDVIPGKDNVTVNITAPNDFNGNMDVIIDNISYPISVINGTGSQVIILPLGNHNLTGINITNNPIYEDIFIPKNMSFVVDSQNTYSIIDNKDMSVFYREGAKFTVRIVDEKGNPVSGKSVTFKVNDIIFTTTSDANGYTSMIIGWKPGKFTITATCEESSVFNSIQVKSVIHATKNVKVKKSKKSTKFKIALWGLKAKIVKKPAFKYNGKTKVPIKIGKDLAGKKVSVKFKGEYFTTKVNSKGKGVLKISKKLARDLKLKKGKKYKGRAVYKDMIIYKNTPVNVKIDGKTYTVKTNKKGAAIFKVTKKMVKKLKAGKTYPYYVEFGEDIAKRNLVIKK